MVPTLAVTGAPAPLTISVRASTAGVPSATPLVSVSVPKEFLTATANLTLLPLPAAGLTPSTTYWLVASATGDSGNHYTWPKSTQTTGAATSPDGITWTTQSFGLLFQVYDQSATGHLMNTYEDAGSRWSAFAYDTNGRATVLAEFTQGQTPTGYAVSERNFTYFSNGALNAST